MISNKRFIHNTLQAYKEDKTILDKSLGFNYKSVEAPSETNRNLDGWETEKANWYTLYTGLFFIHQFMQGILIKLMFLSLTHTHIQYVS